jgi:hypothetical protein
MTQPTQDAISTAVQDWFETNIAVDDIAANTAAYNQVFDSLTVLETMLFAGIDDTTVTAATGALTSTANYADGETITIGLADGGTKTYTLQASLTNVDGNVKVGATEAATIANLHHAINGSGGIAGTDYAMATVAHPDVTATDDSAHVLTLTAAVPGADGNNITATTTAAHATFAHATLTGGAGDSVENCLSAVVTWRDTLRAVPLEKDDDAIAQLDTAVPALNTTIEALFA